MDDRPLLIFLHGWPERGLVWRHQVGHFEAAGWRCVAPDLRGYGSAGAPADPSAYALREVVGDLLTLHDELGGAPAVWVGHDWGGPVAWAMAAHHPGRTRAVASLCVPYAPQGFALSTLLPLIDREIYPAERYPDGQWSYYRFHQTHPQQVAADFEADVAAMVTLMFRPGSPRQVGVPARAADVVANGGWFGAAHRPPQVPRDDLLLSPEDFAEVVAGLERTGFTGPDAWYRNDEANLAYAAEARDGGRLSMPALFVHATYDGVCETVRSRLADPMRAACAALTEVVVDAGHMVMLERPEEVNAALGDWLKSLPE